MLSNRLSHFYDLRGPSITIDTACSSGLVATHMGCQTIRSGEAKMSLVAASQLMIMPDGPIGLSRLQFLSPSSRCYTFDDRANGYARGEGICAMILKSLDDAVRDGDTIRAVIRGSGTNQDGRTPGIVQPSSDAQAALIRSTYEAAGLDANKTSYFEAHGTGTRVGDPLELGAMVSALGTKERDPEQPLYVGSVKTNVGHLEGCAGLAGLLKSILGMENGVIFPSLNFKNPNPKLPLNDWRLRVPTKLTSWPTPGLRRISVNSFGYGGSNAHVIIDDAYNYLKSRGLKGKTTTVALPPFLDGTEDDVDSGLGTSSPSTESEPDDEKHPRLFVLSSPEQAALSRLAALYAGHVDDKLTKSSRNTEEFLTNLAFTLAQRRSTFQWRAATVATSPADLSSSLRQTIKGTRAGKAPGIVYVMTGQGAQWPAMGKELLPYEVFNRSIQSADRYLKSIGADWSVLQELIAPEKDSKIHLAKYSQPLCTIVQMALVDLLSHWGVQPAAVVGHSSGEIACAYALGALSAEDCWKVAYHRGRLSGEIATIAPDLKGSMMSVGLSEEDVQPYLKDLGESQTVVVACVNSPSNVTLSGDSSTLEKLEEDFKSKSVFARRLKVEVAYHSPYMRVVAEDYLKAIKDIQTLPTKSAPIMFSSVTGAPISSSELDASYWIRNMTSPVQFVKAVSAIFPQKDADIRRRKRQGFAVDTIIELGPHSALQGPLRQTLAKSGRAEDTEYISMLLRGKHGAVTSLEAAARLWTKGQSLNFLRVNATEADPEAGLSLPDLPRYPWNHTKRYWHESTWTRDHRFKAEPRRDLIGGPVCDQNSLEPRWRNVVRLSELPWLSDHRIQDSVLLPGASMICSVLEAARQMADKNRMVKGFELRDILVGRAIVVPSGDAGISVALHMKPRKAGTRATESFWHEFTIFSEPKDADMIEHCSGLLRIEYSPDNKEADVEGPAESQALLQEYESYERLCSKAINPTQFYESWKACGMQWGPHFQGLTQIQASQHSACTTVTIQDTKASMPAQYEHEHLLHPTTLDAIFQSTFVPVEGTDEARVPTSFESIYVAADLPKGAGTDLCGFTTLHRKGFNNYLSQIYMSSKPMTEPKIIVKGLACTRLRAMDSDAAADKKPWEIRKICSQVTWKEDLTLLQPNEAADIFAPSTQVDTEITDACEKACTMFMKSANDVLSTAESAALDSPVSRYVQWMQDREVAIDTVSLEREPSMIDSAALAADTESDFLAKLSKTSVDGHALCEISKALPGILDGSIAAPSLLQKDGLLADYYSNSFATKACNEVIAKWVSFNGHKLPTQRILDVGAGTGSLAYQVLNSLGGRNGLTPLCHSYTFTDVDPTYFPAAKERLADWSDWVQYKPLNIENDPIDQEFQNESYDVILAGHVLHATKHIDVALANCMKLLKPGGKLVLGEFTHPSDRLHFVMGTLPSWWHFEDHRTSGPLLDEDEWQRRLVSSGFDAPEIVAKDSAKDSSHSSSMLVTTKPMKAKLALRSIILVQPRVMSKNTKSFCTNVENLLKNAGLHVSSMTIEEATSGETIESMPVFEKHVLSLLEADTPFVANLSEQDFKILKKLLIHSKGGLWVTRSNRQLDPTGDPAFACSTGFLRSYRAEKPDARVNELSLSPKISIAGSEAAELVYRSLRSIYEANSIIAEPETEYAEHNGRILIPRLYDDWGQNKKLDLLGKSPPAELQPFLQPDHPLKLEIGTPGMLDTLRFVYDTRADEPLDDNDVVLEVKANGMNFVDIMVSMGLVSDTELGADAAGIIKRVGSKVTLVKPGDRVATFCLGSYRTELRTRQDLVAKIPDSMSFEDAASLPCVYVTAYQSIYEAARLRKGETILIHSAAGGLGQASIQLAQHIGAEIFVTAGSQAKRDLLVKEYGISEDHVFNSRDFSFAKGIMRMTKGKGVDVVLNSLSGEALRRTWECISMFGRFIEVGKRDILGNTGLEMSPFLRNVTFSGVNLEHMLRHDQDRMAEVLRNTFDLIHKGAAGAIRPTVVYRISEIEKAFRTMQQAKHMGKMILKAEPTDKVPVIPRDPHSVKLREDSTYVLVGGWGGIGRALAQLLMQHGAKHLAILSRSGPSRPEAKVMMRELEEMKFDARSYTCDIGDAKSFESAINRVKVEMPPIKGAIHGTMVLNDYLYDEMTYEQWTGTFNNKLRGGLNMDAYLPKDIDFLVFLSSASGYMGTGFQTNYAAGNTFLDGLSQHRRAQNLPGVALGFGFIAGIGWSADNVDVSDQHKEDYKLMSVSPPEVYSLVKDGISGYSHSDVLMPPQIATCLGTGGEFQHTKLIKTRNWYTDPKYAYLRVLDIREGLLGGGRSAGDELKTSLQSATTISQAADIIEGALAVKLAKSMSMSTEDIDTSKPVSVYGVDSLVSMEIRNWVFTVLRSNVGMFDILRAGPMTGLALKIAENSMLVPDEVKEAGQ
ncbi:MAG: hypothetical protein Q9227_003194 [Pyrenula ochraceoflavens]